MATPHWAAQPNAPFERRLGLGAALAEHTDELLGIKSQWTPIQTPRAKFDRGNAEWGQARRDGLDHLITLSELV